MNWHRLFCFIFLPIHNKLNSNVHLLVKRSWPTFRFYKSILSNRIAFSIKVFYQYLSYTTDHVFRIPLTERKMRSPDREFYIHSSQFLCELICSRCIVKGDQSEIFLKPITPHGNVTEHPYGHLKRAQATWETEELFDCTKIGAIVDGIDCGGTSTSFREGLYFSRSRTSSVLLVFEQLIWEKIYFNVCQRVLHWWKGKQWMKNVYGIERISSNKILD